ncbi:predicted protein [Thalassiosira pseudonana CCMP1335]|uniref:Uncharacterized protein n=1 Tax=Thalassiosira pseudonana TaxID=35128 RepID=B8BWU7_THAPS|nr:predicted protein [Thalassiosira pseudonana CCMP1335]EED93593.1 predicted protein [Thalassiosira pseudonana CCMP1335]
MCKSTTGIPIEARAIAENAKPVNTNNANPAASSPRSSKSMVKSSSSVKDIRSSSTKESSPRAAFQGAPFDKSGFCLSHPKVQLTQPIKNDQGKLMYQELKRTCPSCQTEKHKSRKGTSLSGGKVREGRVHGMPSSCRPSLGRDRQSAGESTSGASHRSRSRSRPKDRKPRKEYDTPFDGKGRCHHHKNVQLAAKKFGGGWKVIHSICPKCMEDKYDSSDDRSVRSGSSMKSSSAPASNLGAKLARVSGSADGQHDKQGCCVLHPHIQVARKKVFGSGFKTLRVCPACSGGVEIGLDDDRMSVVSGKSSRSTKSASSRSVRSPRSVKSSGSRGKAATSSRYGILPFDGDGFCCRHPSVQLATKKLMGGFKIHLHECPDCAAEGSGGKRKVPRRKSSNGTGRVFDDSGSECSSVKSGSSRSRSSKKKRIRVKNMKTLDENGKAGRYSGDVDDKYKMHGNGVMKYEDGTVFEGVWSEGSQVHGKTKRRPSGKM